MEISCPLAPFLNNAWLCRILDVVLAHDMRPEDNSTVGARAMIYLNPGKAHPLDDLPSNSTD